MTKDTLVKTLIQKSVSEEFSRHFPVYEKISQILTNFRSDLAEMKLEILSELQTMREENATLNAQHARVISHEERLEKLEKIHPNFSHQPVVA